MNIKLLSMEIVILELNYLRKDLKYSLYHHRPHSLHIHLIFSCKLIAIISMAALRNNFHDWKCFKNWGPLSIFCCWYFVFIPSHHRSISTDYFYIKLSTLLLINFIRSWKSWRQWVSILFFFTYFMSIPKQIFQKNPFFFGF